MGRFSRLTKLTALHHSIDRTQFDYLFTKIETWSSTTFPCPTDFNLVDFDGSFRFFDLQCSPLLISIVFWVELDQSKLNQIGKSIKKEKNQSNPKLKVIKKIYFKLAIETGIKLTKFEQLHPKRKGKKSYI